LDLVCDTAMANLQLSPKTKKALALCLQDRPEILFAILYGSAAEGLPFRDLDIALFVDRASVPASAELDYAFALADELEQVALHPVDVRVINDAPLPFRYNVSRGIPLLVNEKEAFARFLERTWDEFLDFQPVAMQYLKELQ
jgi:predicted nucleotidyltransferase